MAKKIKNNLRVFCIYLVSAVCLCMLTGTYCLHTYTLSSFLLPVACFVMLAMLSGLFMWKFRFWVWLTGTTSFWSNYLCHGFCVAILVTTLFYGCNYMLAENEEGSTEKAVVEHKYYEVKHRSQRVGRNRYRPGKPYNVYYIKVRFDGGCARDISVSHDRYARLHDGDTVSFFVSRGFFHIPVIKNIGNITSSSDGCYRRSH